MAKEGAPTESTDKIVNPILVTRESTLPSVTTVLATNSSPWYRQALRAGGVRVSVGLLTSVAVCEGRYAEGFRHFFVINSPTAPSVLSPGMP